MGQNIIVMIIVAAVLIVMDKLCKDCCSLSRPSAVFRLFLANFERTLRQRWNRLSLFNSRQMEDAAVDDRGGDPRL